MKLCGFDVQPRHGGAQRTVREGLAQHLTEAFKL
jgi:hypothetical protein